MIKYTIKLKKKTWWFFNKLLGNGFSEVFLLLSHIYTNMLNKKVLVQARFSRTSLFFVFFFEKIFDGHAQKALISSQCGNRRLLRPSFCALELRVGLVQATSRPGPFCVATFRCVVGKFSKPYGHRTTLAQIIEN